MITLVVGASGATGRLLVEQLLDRGDEVRAIIRPGSELPDHISMDKRLTVIEAQLLEMTEQQLKEAVSGCSGVVSCLGHTLSFHGTFSHPRKLVADAVQRLCQAIEDNSPREAVKFILMNSKRLETSRFSRRLWKSSMSGRPP